jgi:D-alanine-D-alanine ligase
MTVIVKPSAAPPKSRHDQETIVQIQPLDPAEFTSVVAVITGGWSRERDRALLSGTTVTEALTSMDSAAQFV